MNGNVLRLLVRLIRNKFPDITDIKLGDVTTSYDSKPFFEVRIYMNVITYDFNPNLERMIYSLFIPHIGEKCLSLYYEQ
jgi:hypothetical protein